jgi:hypothetical protein
MTSENLLGSIVAQLVRRKSVISQGVRDKYQKYATRKNLPLIEELSELLQSESRSFSDIYIIIDALDECLRDETRGTILTELQKLQPLNLMLTGRPWVYNLDVNPRFPDAKVLEILSMNEDITKYVESRINKSTRLQRYLPDSIFRDEVISKIVQKAAGM